MLYLFIIFLTVLHSKLILLTNDLGQNILLFIPEFEELLKYKFHNFTRKRPLYVGNEVCLVACDFSLSCNCYKISNICRIVKIPHLNEYFLTIQIIEINTLIFFSSIFNILSMLCPVVSVSLHSNL